MTATTRNTTHPASTHKNTGTATQNGRYTRVLRVILTETPMVM